MQCTLCDVGTCYREVFVVLVVQTRHFYLAHFSDDIYLRDQITKSQYKNVLAMSHDEVMVCSQTFHVTLKMFLCKLSGL